MAERRSHILDKVHSDTCFSDITLEEHYDLVNSQKLLHSELIDDEKKGSLHKYMKLSNGGKIKVDYKFKDNTQTISFMSVPLGLKSPLDIKEPTTYIYGNFN